VTPQQHTRLAELHAELAEVHREAAGEPPTNVVIPFRAPKRPKRQRRPCRPRPLGEVSDEDRERGLALLREQRSRGR